MMIKKIYNNFNIITNMNFDTLSQQTRATGGSISSDDTYVFDLP